jgi:hypothetical protein
MLAKAKRFLRRQHWHRIHVAKKNLRDAERAIETAHGDFDPSEDGGMNPIAQSLVADYGVREDNLNILLQDKLLRSAYRWGIHVPSLSEKESWQRFPYRSKRWMLNLNYAYDQRPERWSRSADADRS